MTMRRGGHLLIAAALIAAGLALAAPARAQGLVPDCSKTVYTLEGANGELIRGVTPARYEAEYKDRGYKILPQTARKCELKDFLGLFTRLAGYGLGFLGIVAIGFFIYGGFLLLISSGRSEYVTKGKSVLTGTFLGTVVVLTAFVIVNTVGQSLGAKKDLTNTSPSCRKQGPLCSAEMRTGCHDPIVGDGSVIALQRALNEKCGCRLDADGCYGKQTARCVWMFKLANGMTVVNEPERETATPDLVGAVRSASSRACVEDIDVIPPERPPSNPESPTTETAGCCVTSDPDYPCQDTTTSCELYEPPLDPSTPARYTYAPGTCENRNECNRSYRCIDFRRSDPSGACTDLPNPQDSCPDGTIKQTGDCAGWPGF